jgi:hypothetical protein
LLVEIYGLLGNRERAASILDAAITIALERVKPMLQRPLLQLGIFFSTCAVAGGLALDRGVAAREVDSRQLTFDVHPARCAREREHDNVDAARRAIARGQKIFNTAPIVITGVAGLNNQTFPSGVTVPDPFTGTCTTCHDTPNAGDHSVKALRNIGLTDVSRRTADMPLYTLRRLSTGETTQTTEPQREHAIQVLLDFGRRIAARGVQCNREARAERELALVAILSCRQRLEQRQRVHQTPNRFLVGRHARGDRGRAFEKWNRTCRLAAAIEVDRN